MVLLHRDTKTSSLVSAATAELGERILEAYSTRTRWFRQMIPRSGFRAVAAWIERLTIPGILRHYALRKKCLANLGRTALRGGAKQVVVLGAGFDGCALDLSREFPSANFWEVDHPATQRWKAQVMSAADSQHLHLVGADLSQGVLPTDALRASHFDSGADNFWIAEGLLMYFPESVVQSLIGAIGSLTNAGGGLAFSFMEKRDDGRIRFRKQSRLVDWWLGRRSEPFLWSASREEVRRLLHSWKDVTFFDHEDLRALGSLEDDVPLAAGEIICFTTR